MKLQKLHFLWPVMMMMIASFGSLVAQPIVIDQNATPISTNADDIGIWIHSNQDTYEPSYVDLLKELKVKSLRHGWAYSVMDENDPDQFYMSPCDPQVQSYISDGNCNLVETMPLSDVSLLREDLDVPGFAVLSTDGINYTGTADADLVGMNRAEREQFYLDNAVRWAEWGRDNGFQYFELGNENDLPGEHVDHGVGTEWDGATYGAFARRMAETVKSVYPEAICGINGGWRSTPQLRTEWWDGILQGAPDINNWIDFVVIHTYAFGLNYDTWRDNLWEWGRINTDNSAVVAQNFPGKPIYLTEINGFQVENHGGDNFVPHYRSVLAVEMLGNLFLDDIIEKAQVWGTRWGDDLNIDRHTNTLNGLGNGMKAYTNFAKPNLIASGTGTKVRYFAHNNPEDNTMTVWFINHDVDNQDVDVEIENFVSTTSPEVWKLTSVNNDPLVEDNTFEQDGSLDVSVANGTGSFSVNLPGTSVTVVSFDVSISTPPALIGASKSVDGSSIALRFNKDVTNTQAGAAGFSVKVNGANRSIASNEVNGKVLTLNLNSAISNAESTVTVSYAPGVVASNQGLALEAFTDFDVNNAPSITIDSPVNGASFNEDDDVTITVSTDDSDGQVTLVEFYHGETKIGQDNAAPFSVVWNNIPDGELSITAVATDDEGGSTTSAAVTISSARAPRYTLNVVNGAGDGSFKAGEVIAIFGNEVPTGERFDVWTGDVANIAEIDEGTTSITMPASNTTITATYEPIPNYFNVSVNKTATQISTKNGAEASRAVDGNTDGVLNNGSVSQTNCGSEDWWRVDLGSRHEIRDISIYNRSDCCRGRLDDYYVRLLDTNENEVWSNFQTTKAAFPTVIDADTEEGRYIEIQKSTSGCLAIAEVEVFGVPVDGAPVNVAPTVSITSPANNASFTAGDDVTINATASDSDGSVSKVEFYEGGTKLGEDTSSPYAFNWTNVSTGNYSLTAVATDNSGASTTSSAINISVSEAAPTTYSLTVNSGSGGGSYEAGAVVNISANAAPSGQQFDRWTGNTGIIADVNAASTTVTMPAGDRTINATYADIPTGGNDNVALNKTATQSSDFQNFTADLAVDGNTNGQFSGGSVTHTGCGPNDWWRVDLGSNYDVGDINVYNRTDCCSDRLDDYNVKVLNGSLNEVWSNFQSSPAGSPTTVNAGGATGRYVEIQKTTSGCLSIAEVEVFASSGGGTPPANQSPSVNITSPGNNASFTAGDNVSIAASASDSDGSVSKVEFYQGGTKLGEDTSSPYSFNWSNVSAGSYSLTAVATDNDGATTTSAAVSITVNEASSGSGYRYLRITGESKVQNAIRVQRLRWLVGSMEYPNPLLTNGSSVTADPNIAGAWQAFNGNNQPWDIMNNLPASLTIDLGAGGEIEPTGVKIDVNGTNRGFASFSCYGSNDGSNFTLIKSFSGLTASDYPGTVGIFSLDGAARVDRQDGLQNALVAYPNPVHDELNITGIEGVFSVYIHGLRGERVLSLDGIVSGDIIDVSELKKGVYFLNILNEQGERSLLRISKD